MKAPNLEAEFIRIRKTVNDVAVCYLINFIEAHRRGDGSAEELKETLMDRIRSATDDDKYEILKTFNHFTKYAPCKK
jgi:CRISPR/Cas system CSM-associated protein Csm2 small subunit